ncbi:O-antigen ligase family protein [Patescibacteria group bacterium]|nr:O-antigen ligase family protein [Patescibacteria group bacterium]MBU1890020.1 O-antigen ligase family protein [Patescibacteria group bacterium]
MIWILTSLTLFLLLSVYRLKYSVYLIAFLLPTYLVRFSIASLPLTLLEGMIIIIFVVWLARLLFEHKLGEVMFPWKWFILAFLLVATIAVFVSSDRQAAWGLWKAYYVEPILLFLVIVNTLKTSTDRRWLVYSLGLSAIGVSLYAIGQYFDIFNSPGPWINESPKRVSSVFEYPNAVGLYLAPILGIFLGLLAFKNHLFNKVFSSLVIILGVSALIFSFTRGAFLGLLVALIFLGIFSQRKKLVWLFLIIVIVAGLLLPLSRDQITSVVTLEDVSADVRTVLWEGSWNLIKANPVLGSGLAGFPAMYDQYRLIKHTELLLYPHNFFLNFWVELGIAGMILMVILLIIFYRTGFWVNCKDYSPVLSISLLSGMTALFIYGLVEVPYFKNDLAVQFWILFALMALLRYRSKQESSLQPEDIKRLKRYTIK